MKSYTETERQEHVENWRSGTLSKAAYAKSAGIVPTTFYTWAQEAPVGREGFVEIKKEYRGGNNQDIVIEKNGMIIHVPLSAGTKELRAVFGALEGIQ